MERRQLLVFGGIFAAVLAVLALVWFAFLRPGYGMLYEDLREADAAEIVGVNEEDVWLGRLCPREQDGREQKNRRGCYESFHSAGPCIAIVAIIAKIAVAESFNSWNKNRGNSGKSGGHGDPVYFASGSGRIWNLITLLVVPLPVSMWNGARVLTVDHRPLPFHPAWGSSIRPSIHFV